MGTDTHVVTLITDFGLRDHYVAAMKGVMLGVNPHLQFVDITHQIPRHDIYSAAFTLAQAYHNFPLGTINLAVVDPGVGTDRRALAVASGGRFFAVPDNGLLSFVLSREEGFEAFEVTELHFLNKTVSATFHGRDVFAPIAAWISRGTALNQFGPPVEDPVRLKIPAVKRVKDMLVEGAVLAIDSFGNLITNLSPEDVPAFAGDAGRPCKVLAGKREITHFHRTFAEGPAGELFVVPGSSGLLEIVMRDRSAAAELPLPPGTPVGIILG
jgi:S-adenosylmethionine hydrolase